MHPSGQTVNRPGSRHRTIGVVLALLMLAMSASTTSLAGGSWIKLSNGQYFSDIQYGHLLHQQRFKLTPDGTHVVYIHDPDVDEAYELYSVPTTGGDPIRLSGLLPAGSGIRDFEVTADGSRVIYVAPQDALGVNELYSVSIDGGGRVRLNDDLPPGGDVDAGHFQISPDGTQVVYIADQEEDEVDELYSVPIGGGIPIRLNGDLVDDGDVSYYSISPDGSRVVYTATERFSDVSEIFSVPIGGGEPVRLNGVLVEYGDVHWSRISPDSSRVVYQANQQTVSRDELYSVPISGGDAIRLTGTAGGDVEDFLISPDSSMVVYRQHPEPLDLFSVPIGGGDQEQLNDRNWSYLDVEDDYQISPDSGWVVYRGDDVNEWVLEVYSVPISGGTSTRLNGNLATDGLVRDFKISPDSVWVVYRGERFAQGWISGQRVPLAGPGGNDEFVWSGPYATSHFDYQIDSSGSYLIVRGNLALADGIERLWKVPLAGVPDPLGEELVRVEDIQPAGDVTSYFLGTDGTVVYVADQIIDEQFELFAYHPPLFTDGFESGDVSSWSGQHP